VSPVVWSCRKAWISQTTYLDLKKKYVGLLPDEMRRLNARVDKSARLEKIVPNLTSDLEMLRDAIRGKL
jgi:hypothetical protein